MNILLVNNPQKKDTANMVEFLNNWFTARKVELEVQDLSQLGTVGNDTDLVMVLGGDGTILKVARELAGSNVPLLGVNMGTVGFLCNLEGSEINNYLDCILNKHYTVEERMMLQVKVYEDESTFYSCYCLNEVVARSCTPNMINLQVWVDDEEMEPYRGDGVIVSTPTGSTAYSLSSGGPVVEPSLDAIIITPVSSYKATKRPLVVHPSRTIHIKTQESLRTIVSIDGQVNLDFKSNYKIEVNTAPARLKFAAIKRRPFFRLVDRTGK